MGFVLAIVGLVVLVRAQKDDWTRMGIGLLLISDGCLWMLRA